MVFTTFGMIQDVLDVTNIANNIFMLIFLGKTSKSSCIASGIVTHDPENKGTSNTIQQESRPYLIVFLVQSTDKPSKKFPAYDESVNKGFGPVMKMGLSRRFKRYSTTYM